MKNVTHLFRVLTLCLVTLVSSGAWATVQTYQKVTSAPTDWSGEYLIVYEAGNCAMDGRLTKLDAVSNTQAVTITNNTISLDDSYSFTIAPMDGGYSIQANSGMYMGNASNSNGLTSSDNALANTLTLTVDGDVQIVSSGGAYLRYNKTSGQTRFRYYKSSSYSNQQAIHLYKKASTTPPTDVLKSLTVSGTPTKMTYEAGEEFDPAGLTVTGTYSESGNKTVTHGITWTYDPETLTAGTTSVSVTAQVGSVESAAYTVNGLTVIAPKTLTSIAISGTPTNTSYYVGDEFEPEGLVVTGTYDDGNEETISSGITWLVEPETLAVGTTSVSVVAKVGDIESPAYNVNGLTVTEKGAPGANLTLTFDMSKNPGGWPTTNSTTLTNYTYTLDDEDYTFALKNVKSNSNYMMLTQPAALGLPAIPDYKLTKVVAKNTSGCSTSVYVGVSSSATSADYIEGGETQKWATQSSSYTYTLTDTKENTVYYLYVTSKNAQVVSLELTYVTGTPSSTPSISASNVKIDADATSGKIAYTIKNPVAGKTLSATTTATWISNIQVTDEKVTFTTTANTGTAKRTADITLKYEGATDKVVTVTQAKPVPTYASLAALVAAGAPTTEGEPVNVTLTNEEITKFQTSGSYTNGVYLMVGTQEIEIYCKDVPDTWEVGGTISGTLTNCTWKKFGTTWELCPTSWDLLEYTAPAPGTLYTITWSVNGTTTTEDVEEGDPINFKPATVPAGYTDYAFRGWTTESTVDAEPTYVTEATATADVTYYAVFAKKTITGTASLTKLDGTSTLADGDKLAIFAHVGDNYYGMKHQTVSSSYVNFYVLEEEPTYEAVAANDLNWWTLNSASEGTWTLGDKKNGYLVNASSNELVADGSEGGSLLTIAWNSDNGAYTIKNGDRWIGCRSDLFGDNQYKFRGAGNSTTSKSSCYLDIYRISTGTVTYSDFTTTLVAPEAYTLEVSKYGYSTLYLDKAVEIPEGVTVYYCTYKNAESLSAVKIDGDYIPANTGVVVEAKAGTYAFNYTDQQVDEFSGSVLGGVLVDTPVQEIRERDHNAPVYVLSIVNGKVGFYNYADTATLKANRAFFEGAEEQSPVKGFILDFNGTEGINTVVRATNLKAGYDLQGRRINQMQKGINILNGKKVIK